MRFKTLRTKTIKIAHRVTVKDSEGVPIVMYGEPATFKCEMWPAQSELQVKTYGERVNAMFNVKLRGAYQIESDQSYTFDSGYNLREGDGVFVYREPEGVTGEGPVGVTGSETPDYKVISIKPYKPLRLEIEKL